jgi:hypothetical protein
MPFAFTLKSSKCSNMAGREPSHRESGAPELNNESNRRRRLAALMAMSEICFASFCLQLLPLPFYS